MISDVSYMEDRSDSFMSGLAPSTKADRRSGRTFSMPTAFDNHTQQHRVSHSSASSSSSTTSFEHERFDGGFASSLSAHDIPDFQLPNPVASPKAGAYNQYTSFTTLNRQLTQAVLRFDQLTGSFMTLRSQLRKLLDSVNEQEADYEECIEEIGQLRFERKFLREVVELSTARERRELDALFNVEGNTAKRWSTPVNGGIPNSDTDRRSRRWSSGTDSGCRKPSPSSGRSSPTTFLPHEDDDRVTVDDLASRKVQRRAFSMMLQSIRDTFLAGSGLTGCLDSLPDLTPTAEQEQPMSPVSDSSLHALSTNSSGMHSFSKSQPTSPIQEMPSATFFPKHQSFSGPQVRHTNTVQTRLSQLLLLIEQLAPSVEALRETHEDVMAGPYLAYRAWLREAEMERELLRVECEGLREAREGVRRRTSNEALNQTGLTPLESAHAFVTRTVSTSEIIESLWGKRETSDFPEEEHDDDTESVYFSCDEADDGDF
ncbi:hypothetical protein DFS34DRAFT_224961 [Phlyctochytrium arcticum]|nr:hypothetical protein DFS34DRAFT_224961 [Phlyctochytrium arcticum]